MTKVFPTTQVPLRRKMLAFHSRQYVPGNVLTKPIQFGKKRQGFEPTENLVMGFAALAHVTQEGFVLILIFVTVFSKKCTRLVGMRSGPGYCIQFVVAHDGEGLAVFNHAASDFDGFHLLGAPIHKVAEKNYLALWVLPDLLLYFVAKLL